MGRTLGAPVDVSKLQDMTGGAGIVWTSRGPQILYGYDQTTGMLGPTETWLAIGGAVLLLMMLVKK